MPNHRQQNHPSPPASLESLSRHLQSAGNNYELPRACLTPPLAGLFPSHQTSHRFPHAFAPNNSVLPPSPAPKVKSSPPLSQSKYSPATPRASQPPRAHPHRPSDR